MKCYVKIFGGFGNQLFQYSFGKYLERKNVKVIYDISHYEKRSNREFILEEYDLNIQTLSQKHIKYKPTVLKKLFIKAGLGSSFTNIEYEKEGFIFNEISIKKNQYFIGYWQNPKYLELNKNYLKKKFNSRYQIETKLDNDITNIGIHIRRGDYLLYDKYNVYDNSYFFKAINFMEKKIKGLKKYYVFSDDILYCKSIFKNKSNFYFQNGSSIIDDFETMKRMDHIIISNSTFSWWAAWLSDKKNKITICPKIWMKGYADVELIQENWIKI